MTVTDTRPPAAPAAAPHRRHRAWAVVGVLLGAVMIVAAGLSVAALLARHEDTVHLSLPATSHLVLNVNAGDVTVTGGAGDTIVGTAHRTWSFRQPSLVQSRDGDTVTLSVDCRGSFTGYCDASFDIQVPASAAVTAHTGSGMVTATGLSGDASLSTGSGDITVRNTTGALDLTTGSGMINASDVTAPRITARDSSGDITVRNTTGTLDLTTGSGMINASNVTAGSITARNSSGDVRLTGVTGELNLTTGSGMITVTDSSANQVTAHDSSGDIRLDLTTDPQTVDAQTSSGQIAVAVPNTPGVAYRLTMHTNSGLTSGQIRTDPAAARSITATNGSGDVTVRYR
ncbi:MAG: DUF4097 family beta strand repeat-containing protein [Micrococcales bacterium]|nr:DUF4097 family beta strand repeat-containing protein [Micrococcales bacterium]